MRILDLFCGGGGASVGFRHAFPDAEIFGVDIEPQPNYPFWFHRGDAFDVDLSKFDFIHASPPCTDHSKVGAASRSKTGGSGTGWMLAEIGERLAASGKPWVIENVEGAEMPPGHAFKLCGSSFGLDLRRHRKFVTSFFVPPLACNHAWQTPRFIAANSAMRARGQLATVISVHGNLNYEGELELRKRAMGIDWMSNTELVQAIPPAFTEYVGNAWRNHAEGS